MSCGNPQAEGEEALMRGRSKFDKSKNCIKCKVEKGNLVIRHTVYCKNCFFPLVTIKFRRCIEPHINESPETSKRTALKASGDLLVGFSGGLGSTVLLDILSRTYFPSPAGEFINSKGGRAHPRNKKVWNKGYVCYVEVCNAFPEGQMKDRSEDIRKFLERHENFEPVLARMEDAFDPEWWERIGGRIPTHTSSLDFASEGLPVIFETLSTKQASESPTSSLRNYLSSLPTPTAIHSSISSLVRLILVHLARYLRCSHVALGTSLTSTSISLISGIAQGGGFHIREELFEEWQSPSDTDNTNGLANPRPIRLVRPLRDAGMKECAAWAYWKGLSIVGREKMPGISAKQSIVSLTKGFIVGLERDYPSTVSTIVRTCSKVAPKEDACGHCLLCERPMPSAVLQWKARISIRSLAENDPSREPKAHPGPGPDFEPPLLPPRLCYVCHTHLTSKSPRHVVSSRTPACLPQWTNARLSNALPTGDSSAEENEIWSTTAMSQERMKAVADEFILET